MPTYKTVPPETFDEYPTKPAKGPDEWDDLFLDLASGRTVQIPLAEEKQWRGYRLALGRRAKARGMQLDVRHDEKSMIIRNLGEASEVAQKPRAPRKAKTEAAV